MNNFKTVTSSYIRKEFPDELKPFYWKPYYSCFIYIIVYTIMYITNASPKKNNNKLINPLLTHSIHTIFVFSNRSLEERYK
nr:hypothetical protein [Bacillus sp. NP247]